MTDEREGFDSTLVRRGTHASTLTEIEEFVETIEERPLDKLLADLPGLVSLSRTKFDLARQVVRRRVNHLADIDRDQLRILANEVASNSADDVAQRIRTIFA